MRHRGSSTALRRLLTGMAGTVLIVAQLGGGGLPTSRATDRINDMSTRGLPPLPPAPAPRPDMIWVPEQYVPAPGAPQGLKVPGHWERRVSERESYAPPLVVCDPASGACRTVPAGVQPSLDQRQFP
jgi:hypothetical protein